MSVALLVFAGLYLGTQWLENRNAKPEPRGDYQLRYEDEQVTVNGVKYRQKKNLTTLLFMGIDRDSGAVRGVGNRNGGQADFLRLIVIDQADKTISQIQIDRDTMTPITVLSVLGNRSGTRTLQISLSHGYGDGKEQSCQFTVDAVSNMLFNVPINGYIAMNLDGINVLNDALGGLTVTLEDDFSHIDPTMTKGKTLTLMGKQAEIFVRSRMSMEVGTNEARMIRQQQYLSKMMDLLHEKVLKDKEFIGTLFDSLSPYLVTNVSRAQMINDAWLARDYERKPLYIPEGTHVVGTDGYMEFHVDEDALEQMVLELFYQKMK
jgi:LCP family protein required for cell wall assembly